MIVLGVLGKWAAWKRSWWTLPSQKRSKHYMWRARFYTGVKMNKSRNWHGEIRNYVERVVNPFFCQLWWQNVRFLFLQHEFLFQFEIFSMWDFYCSQTFLVRICIIRLFQQTFHEMDQYIFQFQFVLLQNLFKMGFASSKMCWVSSTIWIANVCTCILHVPFICHWRTK